MNLKHEIVKENAHQLLLQEWDAAKSEGWTQTKMAKDMGIAQATFSQYLRGVIPLNASFLVKFSRIRRINPANLGAELGGEVSRVSLPVKFSTLGVVFKGKSIEMAGVVSDVENAFLVEVDKSFATFPKGSLLVCEMIAVGAGDNVVAHKEVGGVMTVLAGELRKNGDGWCVVEPLATGEQLKPVDKTWTVAKITGVTLPKSEPTELF